MPRVMTPSAIEARKQRHVLVVQSPIEAYKYACAISQPKFSTTETRRTTPKSWRVEAGFLVKHMRARPS